MKIKTYNLWDNTPGMCEEIPKITHYPAIEKDGKKSSWTIIILPGGGYSGRAKHEGEGYAKFLSENGVNSFVVDYRVFPHRFPLPLLDARRAVRFVRYYSEKFGVDKDKVAIMGSSAGGHLAALTSTYYEKIDFEDIDAIDKEDFLPNAQILCYPVIKLLGKWEAHLGSGQCLLGENHAIMGEELSPNLIATKKTPKAFIWHTFEDSAVPVGNSLDYAKKLKELNVDVELHIFPNGHHGLGLCLDENNNEPYYLHVKQWGNLLINWLSYNE